MDETSFRGGARIGWVNASWPFAKLIISADRIALVTLSSYEFSPSEVVSVEPYGAIPFLSSGIRINHNRADYPEKIIFWCMGNRSRVLAEFRKCGFSSQGHPAKRAAGFPFRWSVVIAVVALWNILFLLDRASRPQSPEPGGFVLLAMAALFVLATAIRTSPRIQRMVLREGHQLGEITAFLALLQIVAGILSLALFGMWIIHTFVA